MTMWKAAVLTLILLVALVARAQHNEGQPSFYGVKLCGREFIRAVIFTCGGSRWRRSLGDSGDIGGEAFDPWNSNSAPASRQHPSEPQVWKGEKLDAGSAATVQFSRLARSPTSEDVLESLQSFDRKGRDLLVGVSNACCKWGCSKSEISSLC